MGAQLATCPRVSRGAPVRASAAAAAAVASGASTGGGRASKRTDTVTGRIQSLSRCWLAAALGLLGPPVTRQLASLGLSVNEQGCGCGEPVTSQPHLRNSVHPSCRLKLSQISVHQCSQAETFEVSPYHCMG